MQNNTAEQKILEAAFRVVDQKTISGTRMHLIAEEAGMVQSNLHYYFKTKKDLLIALLHYIQADFSDNRTHLMEQQAHDLKGQVHGFFCQKQDIIMNRQAYDRAQFDYWCLGQVDPEINSSFLEFYDFWRKNIVETVRLYEPGIPEEKLKITAYIMVSMMMGASMQYLNAQGSFDLNAYFAACEQMVFAYLEV